MEHDLFDRYSLERLLVAEALNVHPDAFKERDGDPDGVYRLGDKLWQHMTMAESARCFEDMVAAERQPLTQADWDKMVWETIASQGRGPTMSPVDGVEIVLRVDPKRMLSFCRKHKLFEGLEWFDENPFKYHSERNEESYLYRMA